MQILIMTEARTPGRGDPRLCRIDFPRMEVEHCGLSFLFINTTNRPRRYPVRQEAKISAACHWEIRSISRQSRRRKLDDASSIAKRSVMKKAGSIGNTVLIMNYRKDARVILETGFL